MMIEWIYLIGLVYIRFICIGSKWNSALENLTGTFQ